MRALVIGFGSIGQRHARVLAGLGLDVAVVSRRPVDHPRVYADVVQALTEWRPGYVVVASRTAEHAHDLDLLAGLGFDGVVMMEKPLFDHVHPLPTHRFARAYVGFNLRFHPVITAFRQRLAGLDPVALHVCCGSYLPDWRPQADYRKGYSAIKAEGGGVLRDLSHEIDYTLWFLGGWTSLTAAGGHLSGLEIDSDDAFALILRTPKVDLATITLDYLDTRPRRQILALTNSGSLKADVVAGTLEWCGEVVECFTVARDDTYVAMHHAVLENDETTLCTLAEGAEVTTVIDAVEAAANKQWVSR